jgi:hypothetical protein
VGECAGQDERETEVEVREDQLGARDAAQEERKRRDHRILAAAEDRDDKADARDAEADRRDAEADFNSFMHDEAYGANIQARRSAALDRLASRSDRRSAAEDRIHLAAEVEAADEVLPPE